MVGRMCSLTKQAYWHVLISDHIEVQSEGHLSGPSICNRSVLFEGFASVKLSKLAFGVTAALYVLNERNIVET